MTNQIKLHGDYVGKTREGKRVEIVGPRESHTYPWMGSNRETYTDRGTVLHECAHYDDIIGPWVDAPTPDYNNGEWWGWNGGECPVHPKSRIDANNGCWAGFAAEIDWQNFRGTFRVVMQYVDPPKPREFWVDPERCIAVTLYHHGYIHVREVLDT